MSDFVKVSVNCPKDFHSILIAELGLIDFDTFQEMENRLDAYASEPLFDNALLEAVFERYSSQITDYAIEKVAKENWNKKWEENFQPIVVDDQCLVRASFHPSQNFKYEIEINPKMSFGTGHHATTHLMLSTMMRMDFDQKDVYDLGCGTGILAIMARKLGANKIEGNDVDEWCLENSKENFALNLCPDIKIHLGEVSKVLEWQPVDIVLANINKNVLLTEMSHYSRLLKNRGKLLLSGFYENDLADITSAAQKNGLLLNESNIREDWACVLFEKA